MVTASYPRYSPDEVVHYSGIEASTFAEQYEHEMAPKVIYDCHRSNFYHVFRYTGRRNIHYVEESKLAMGSDSLLIINQNILHRYARHKSEGNVLLFSNAFFGNTQEKVDYLNASLLFKQSYVVIPAPSARCLAVVDACHAMIRKFQPGQKTDFSPQTPVNMPPHYAITLRNWLHVMLLEVERELRASSAKLMISSEANSYMQQFKTRLDECYQIEKQVSFYAAELGLSDKKLSNIVQSVHGLSAKEYICEKVLQEANWLLKYTTLSQGEIAVQLGFDFTYFVKFFRKHTGVTPAKHRRSVRAATLQITPAD